MNNDSGRFNPDMADIVDDEDIHGHVHLGIGGGSGSGSNRFESVVSHECGVYALLCSVNILEISKDFKHFKGFQRI